jgi:hypothetical protein
MELFQYAHISFQIFNKVEMTKLIVLVQGPFRFKDKMIIFHSAVTKPLNT